jgi:hypothetical protein
VISEPALTLARLLFEHQPPPALDLSRIPASFLLAPSSSFGHPKSWRFRVRPFSQGNRRTPALAMISRSSWRRDDPSLH